MAKDGVYWGAPGAAQDKQALSMFQAAKAAVKKQMLISLPQGIAIGSLSALHHRQSNVEHLTCFAGMSACRPS